MQKIKLLILALGMSFLGSTCLQAQDDSPQNEHIVFHEDFETASNLAPFPLPEGWTETATPDNPQDRWQAGQITEGDQTLAGSSGQYYMYITYSTSDHDAWAFSPAMNLEAGKEYAVRLSLILLGNGDGSTSAGIREELDIFFGGSQSANDMTFPLTNVSGYGSAQWGTYSVEKTFTPEASGVYHLGFHTTSPAYTRGIMIDDLYVYETSVPTLSCEPFMDFGTFLDIAPAIELPFLIQNTGKADLQVNLSASSPEITLSGLPLSITPDDTDTVSVTLDARTPGSYNGFFVLESNDPFLTHDTIRVSAQVDKSRLSSFHFEDFESGGPEGWTFAIGSTNVSDGGIDGSRCFYGNSFSESGAQVSTHCIEMGEQPEISFYYLLEWGAIARMFGATGLVPADIPTLEIEASTDFGLSWERAWIMEPGGKNEHVKSEDYQLIAINFPQYANQTVMFRFTFTSSDPMQDIDAYMDNMSFGTQYENDLAINVLSGPAFITPGTDTAFHVQISNRGKNAQASYNVKLFDYMSGSNISEVPGIEVASGATATMSIPWKSGSSGTNRFYAEIDLENDQDSSNNRSNTLNVAITYPDDIQIAVGDSNITSSGLPINFYVDECVTQSIYYANEIATTAGIIHSISYDYIFDASYLSENFSVYVGETLKEDFSDMTFIDTASLTKVFEGSVQFPGGKGTFAVPFQTPYKYHGGNFVVCIIKLGQEFVLGKSFLVSKDDHGAARSLSCHSYTEGTLDPAQLPQGTPSIWYPNIKINIALDPNGSLQGRVSDVSGPVCDARVQVAGTALNTYTDEDGLYSFPTIAEGIYAIEVSKHGYATATPPADITITAGQSSTKDIMIERLPTFSVSGQIRHAVNGSGIERTYVSLSGYDEFSTYTDKEGKYLFTGVCGDSGFIYKIHVNNYLYEPVRDSIRVENANVNKDFDLEEKTLAVSEVSASRRDAEKQVDLHWRSPLPEFRYDNGDIADVLGFAGGTATELFGNAYPNKAILHELSWYISSEAARNEKVNVYIFALDSTGYPSSKILYQALDVPNTCDAWTTYQLPAPIEADGFCIALSCTGYLSIGVTTPDYQYPLEPGMSFYNSNPYAIQFTDMTEFAPYVLMIRAIGEDLGTIEYPQTSNLKTDKNSPASQQVYPAVTPIADKGTVRPQPAPTYKSMVAKNSPVESYTVYRLAEGQPQEDWALVGITQDTCLSDKDVFSLEEGTYQWAVVANYKSGESSARLSNSLLIRNVANEAESAAQGIRLYPNPFSNEVCLNDASAIRSIRIVNMLGQTMTRIDKPASSVNTECLPSGLYFWLIETQDGELRTFKMIKD